jgi:hypothetical protein
MLLEYVKTPFYVLIHPFDGFWDVKYENKGKLWAAFCILLLLTITMILERQLAGFLVNFNDPRKLNSIDEFKTIIIPFFLWCVANWSLTTLMDGEGKFRDIVIVTGYALLPIVLIHLPNTLFSNFITDRESAFYFFFNTLAFIWFLWLLFIGTMTVHQFSVTKTLVTMLLTLVVAGIIIFLGLLIFSLLQQIANFILTIYQELSLRV